MERYEVRVKFDEIKRLAEAGNYQAAMEVADTVDWDRVKNIGMLCQAGEIYERCRYYEDSKAIYERAYRIQPQSRVIVYRLANVSIKLKEFDEAKEYLEEYRSIVPYDPNNLVLTYKIRKGEGADLKELIAILEKLNKKDYHEKWAYELAVLYAEAEEEEKCAKECDNIFLWFGEGRYVLKALKLKSIFRTLTTEQEKYLHSGMPLGADATMSRAKEAVKESEEKEQEFIKLQKEIKSSVPDEEKIRDMEEVREQAINAYREAKAAELLNEAYMEKQQEEERIDSVDTNEMLDETKLPTFNLPIMDVIQKSVGKSSLSEEVKVNVVPGMEFIDMSEVSEEAAVTEEKLQSKESHPIEEVRERIHSIAEESGKDLDLIGYEIKDEAAEIPTIESNESKSVHYTDMGELLSHADEMKSDDLARSLAMLLSGKIEDEENGKDLTVETEFENPGKKIQGVINRIWSKSPVKKAEYQNDDNFKYDAEIDNIEIAEGASDRFDTINLQKDLASGVSSILNNVEKDELDKTIAVADRSAIRGMALKDTVSQEKSESFATAGKSDWEEELGDILSEETLKKIQEFDNFDIFEQDSDGQIKLNIEIEEKKDDSIPGQINLEDYFVDSDKDRTIDISREYMKQVSLAIPDITEEEVLNCLADSQKELLSQARRLMESTNPSAEEIDSVMKNLSLMIAYTNKCETEQQNEQEKYRAEIEEAMLDMSGISLEDENEFAEVTIEDEEISVDSSDEEDSVSMEESVEESLLELTEAEEELPEISEIEEDIPELVEPEEELPEITGIEEDIPVITESEEELPEIEFPEIEMPELSEETLESMAESKEKFMDSISDVGVKEVKGVDKKKAQKQVIPMSDEQMDIMDYFMNVPEIENQIADFIENQHDKFENMIICGATGSGRASLALRLYKSIRLNNPELPNHTLKVDSDALNKKSVLKIYEKISSGIVIIEHAGLLNEMAVSELKEAMKKYEEKIYTIIIGNPDRIEKLLEKHKEFDEMCKYKFTLPEYNQDQFVDFAKNYAYSYGYVIDDMALLALYSELSSIKTRNKLITLQDVKNIINDAMTNNEKRNKNLFGSLFSKNKDREGNYILKEKDFVV